MGKKKTSSLTVAYKLLHHRLFEKEILKIPHHHQQKVYKILHLLASSPTKLPPSTLRLGGYEGVYRTRIGDFRLIYQISQAKKTIFVLGVGSRGNVYKLIRRMLS